MRDVYKGRGTHIWIAGMHLEKGRGLGLFQRKDMSSFLVKVQYVNLKVPLMHPLLIFNCLQICLLNSVPQFVL